MTEPQEQPGPVSGWDVWAPRVTRVFGWAGVVFVAVVWLVTDRIDPLLVSLFGSFAVGGEALAAWKDFKATGPRSNGK